MMHRIAVRCGQSILIVLLLTGSLFARKYAPVTVSHQIYGDCVISEPLLIDILESPQMQRLHHVHQYGVSFYLRTHYNFTRYEHSVGVMMIVRRFGGSVLEQAAALSHDLSHTVFSHVGEHVFLSEQGTFSEKKDAYQDDKHSWYLQEVGFGRILAPHGVTIDQINHKNGNFLLLDQDTPRLCADRIEYNLSGGWYENKLTKQEVHAILGALRFKDGQWYMVDIELARKFAHVALHITQELLASDWNCFTYSIAAQALRRAVQIGLVTFDEIHFSIDDPIWERLITSNDEEIKTCMNRLLNYAQSFVLTDDDSYDLFIRHKFRFVDPFVQQEDGTLALLSSIDETFAQCVKTVGDPINRGYRIRILQ